MHLLGRVFRLLGKMDQAVRLQMQALALEPCLWSAMHELGQMGADGELLQVVAAADRDRTTASSDAAVFRALTPQAPVGKGVAGVAARALFPGTPVEPSGASGAEGIEFRAAGYQQITPVQALQFATPSSAIEAPMVTPSAGPQQTAAGDFTFSTASRRRCPACIP